MSGKPSYNISVPALRLSILLIELESTVNEILLLISSLSDHDLYGVAWYEQWTLGRMIHTTQHHTNHGHLSLK